MTTILTAAMVRMTKTTPDTVTLVLPHEPKPNKIQFVDELFIVSGRVGAIWEAYWAQQQAKRMYHAWRSHET